MSELIRTGLVSTIIPVFNRPKFVVEAIKSVLEQDYRPIEIIVVDDGSTDATHQVLMELQKEHSQITVLTQQNSGPGVAREYGRQKAEGEFIQYLDSDDLLLPGKFSLQVGALKNNLDSAVAYGKTEHIKFGAERMNQAWKATGEELRTMFPDFLRHRWWGTSTPLYRRSVTDQAGAWLPLINEEDWEYDSRIASLGGKLTYIDEFVSVQRAHGDHLSSESDKDITKLKHRSQVRHAIYQNAGKYNGEISVEDWLFFSKSVFLLARQCANSGLRSESESLLSLSSQVCKDHGFSHYKQSCFQLLSNVFGYKFSVTTSKIIERCRSK